MQLSIFSYWTFSDIFDEVFYDSIPFHNGFGLLTVRNIAKPAFRAFQLLHHLGRLATAHFVASLGKFQHCLHLFAMIGTKKFEVQSSNNSTVSAVACTNGTHFQVRHACGSQIKVKTLRAHNSVRF